MKLTKKHLEIIDQLEERYRTQLEDECGEIAHELLNEENCDELTEDQVMERFNEIHHSLLKGVTNRFIIG